MDILDWIVMLIDTISSWFSQFFFQITKFFNWVLSVLSYIWSILEALWYWLVTLVSWTYDMIVDLFDTNLFTITADAFNYVSWYIWNWWTWFVATLMFMAILRIWFAFLFKHFRMNIDYKKNKLPK